MQEQSARDALPTPNVVSGYKREDSRCRVRAAFRAPRDGPSGEVNGMRDVGCGGASLSPSPPPEAPPHTSIDVCAELARPSLRRCASAWMPGKGLSQQAGAAAGGLRALGTGPDTLPRARQPLSPRPSTLPPELAPDPPIPQHSRTRSPAFLAPPLPRSTSPPDPATLWNAGSAATASSPPTLPPLTLSGLDDRACGRDGVGLGNGVRLRTQW